jgi:predicted dinucleotide-binding enzyme
VAQSGRSNSATAVCGGVPIATDSAEAARVAAALVRDVGLDPVFVGALSRAKEFDRGTSIWETGASVQDIREALGLRQGVVFTGLAAFLPTFCQRPL